MLSEFIQHVGWPERRDWTLVHHEEIAEKPPKFGPIPRGLDRRVKELINRSGEKKLYSHQAAAVRLALGGKNVVLATSTASGKTLAYQIPIAHSLLRSPDAHALFLFPLKALERDQRDAFLEFAGAAGLTAEVYDGDTPESLRRKIRRDPPRALITNPDMLHMSLLAYPDTWKSFLANLSHVVLDEVHTYKGIFGSHIAQVLMRLKRICALHDVKPRFFASSATIANPGDFVSRLLGEEVSVVDKSGAPSSKRHFLFIDPTLSMYTVATRLFIKALNLGLKTIVFTRARKVTELISTWVMNEAPYLRGRISSYRAGFLPSERREIEADLFSGRMDGVISTSALEMGIDVGGLDLCILVGYPGTIMNTWQRGGRVGRAGRQSAIAMIAGQDALDRYFLDHPEDFFSRSCEQAILDPFNVEVLKRHLPCAAAEAPILDTEELTSRPNVMDALVDLERDGAIYRWHEHGSWHSSRKRPHREVDLRAIGESFSIFLENRKTPIGSSSGVKAFTECHEGAVYLHRMKQFVVTKLDLEKRNVLVQPARLNYYTKALSEKDTEITSAPLKERSFPGYRVRLGRLKVTQQITHYEKRHTSGQELLGVLELDLPPLHFHTVGLWLEIPDAVQEAAKEAHLHFMGGIHAMEHAAISVFPLFALCDRDDIGGISTPEHPQVCKAAVFIYDGHPGGVGLCEHMFDRINELLEKTRELVRACKCEQGCPSCIHSPKCGSGNKPLDKSACLMVLDYMLEPERMAKEAKKMEKPSKFLIFPDLAENPGPRRGQDRAPTRKAQAAPPKPPTVRNDTSSILKDKRVAVFDLETQMLAQDVGGWKNVSRMGLSLAVVHCEEEGFVTFTEDKVDELVSFLKSADLVVGFNHVRFDYEVLKAYTNENLRGLPNLDILVDVHKALGFRLKLDSLAGATLNSKKSGNGLEAVQWYRQGRMDLIEEYCRQDVEITRQLFRFGLERGYLMYPKKDGQIGRVEVDWRSALDGRPL